MSSNSITSRNNQWEIWLGLVQKISGYWGNATIGRTSCSAVRELGKGTHLGSPAHISFWLATGKRFHSLCLSLPSPHSFHLSLSFLEPMFPFPFLSICLPFIFLFPLFFYIIFLASPLELMYFISHRLC